MFPFSKSSFSSAIKSLASHRAVLLLLWTLRVCSCTRNAECVVSMMYCNVVFSYLWFMTWLGLWKIFKHVFWLDLTSGSLESFWSALQVWSCSWTPWCQSLTYKNHSGVCSWFCNMLVCGLAMLNLCVILVTLTHPNQGVFWLFDSSQIYHYPN